MEKKNAVFKDHTLVCGRVEIQPNQRFVRVQDKKKNHINGIGELIMDSA